MFGVEKRSGIGTPVVDDDGDEGGGGDGLSPLPTLLDRGITLAVVQVHRVLSSLGRLHLLRPGNLFDCGLKLLFVLATVSPGISLPRWPLSQGRGCRRCQRRDWAGPR